LKSNPIKVLFVPYRIGLPSLRASQDEPTLLHKKQKQAQRGLLLPDLEAHSSAMGQQDCFKEAQTHPSPEPEMVGEI